MVATVHPDMVFVLGRHADMAEVGHYLIEIGLPFVVEKPGGVGLAEVEALAAHAERTGAFAAVPFVLRRSDFAQQLLRLLQTERLDYFSAKWIGSPPSKYQDLDQNWMLHPDTAGGGCLTNLGIHYLDLMAVLLGSEISVSSAVIESTAWGLPVEDYALVTLRGSSAIGSVETGYLYPPVQGEPTFDLRYSVKTEHHYLTAVASDAYEVRGLDGTLHRYNGTTSNTGCYAGFVEHVISELRQQAEPEIDYRDLVSAMRLVTAAYELGRKPDGDSS
jgi:predicted dehydrogenase